MAAAAAAEVRTELASRVAGWRQKITPVLEEQDMRGDFDIHTCVRSCTACSSPQLAIYPNIPLGSHCLRVRTALQQLSLSE